MLDVILEHTAARVNTPDPYADDAAYLAQFAAGLLALRMERRNEAQTPDEPLVQLDVDEFVTEREYASMYWRGWFK